LSNSSLPEVPDDFTGRIVLGIDPGTQVVGYGAVVDRKDGPVLLAAGVLRAPAKEAVSQRLGYLARELEVLIARLKPSVIVVEEAFCGKNIQSALRIGEARGVALAAAARFGSEIVQYPPAVAKRSVVGHGAADKQHVARMVAKALHLAEPPDSLDATDALALALTYLNRAASLGTLLP
jgi:crossover junction endodeoxyribonuclease RuvC